MPAAEREEVRRFEWPCPGDLLQMDTKRLARFARPGHRSRETATALANEKRARVGWEFCHSIIDDHTRLAYTEIHPDEKAPTVTAFVDPGAAVLRRPWHPSQAPANRQRLVLHPQPLAAELLAEHEHPAPRIPPRTPKRNGKVERYQQTLAREWAYGQRYRNSDATSHSAAHLAQPLQHDTQPQLPLKPATHQPRSKPPEAQQLGCQGSAPSNRPDDRPHSTRLPVGTKQPAEAEQSTPDTTPSTGS